MSGQTPSPPPTVPRLAVGVGLLMILLALAWLPGQTHAGALRLWLVTAVFPLWMAPSLIHRTDLAWRWMAPWAGLVGWNVVAAARSSTPGIVLDGLLTQSTWLFALALGMRLGTEQGSMRTLARWGSVAGALAALGGWVMEGGTFGNRDLLGGFLLGTVLLTIESLRRTEHRGWRRGLWLSLVLQLVTEAWIRNLGAFLGLSVSLWALGGLRWISEQPSRQRHKPWLFLLPVGACLMSLLIPVVWQHVLGRWYMWTLATWISLSSFPWGVGLGNLHPHFLETQALHLADHVQDLELWTNAYHAHNEPLQALAEQGVVGLILVFLPMVVALTRGRHSTAWGCVLAWTVYGGVSHPLYEPATCLLFGLCTGVVLQRLRRSPSLPRVARSARLIGLALASTLAVISTSELLGDRLLARGARESSPELMGWAAQFMLRPERAWQYQADTLMAEDAQQALELARQAVQRDPSPAGWLLVGRAATALGHHAVAIDAFQQSVRLHPRLFAGHFNLSLAYEAAGDRFSARRHAERARSLRPTDPRLNRLPR